jgi:lycopene cyclase domain-containing protein
MWRKSIKQYAFLLLILAVALVIFHWLTDTVKSDNLIFQVNPPFQLSFLETPYLYLYLHLFAFIPVLALSFDKKVAYYKTWKHLLPALLIVAVIFWVWDIIKTYYQVWGFNPKYYTLLFINLPIEEWFFFITFPFCSVFIFECIEAYFPKDILKSWDTPLSIFFSLGCLFVGFFNWGHSYTATTWIPAGLFALWHFITFDNHYRTRFYKSFFIMLIPFYLVNSVLTGSLTHEPIVVYNPEEYLGIRLGTVPLDDFAYNFLLQFMLLTVYMRFKQGAFRQNTEGVVSKSEIPPQYFVE